MDVVYVVRGGDHNPELKHSIRSITQHFPIDQLVIAGYCPNWLNPDLTIPVLQLGSKYRRAEANLLAAATHPRVSDPFLYMNDDMYLMEDMDRIPAYALGPLDEVIAFYRARPGGKGTYLRGMLDTQALLQSMVDRPLLSYEGHTPMELSKDRLIDVLTLRPDELDDYHWRTVYGALYVDEPQVLEHDVKVYMHTLGGWDTWPLLSTSDATFTNHPVGKHLRATFPNPSRYEY